MLFLNAFETADVPFSGDFCEFSLFFEFFFFCDHEEFVLSAFVLRMVFFVVVFSFLPFSLFPLSFVWLKR